MKHSRKRILTTHTGSLPRPPELVADRIPNHANIVGGENVIAGVDCGFGTFSGRVQVDRNIVWMKWPRWPRARNWPRRSIGSRTRDRPIEAKHP